MAIKFNIECDTLDEFVFLTGGMVGAPAPVAVVQRDIAAPAPVEETAPAPAEETAPAPAEEAAPAPADEEALEAPEAVVARLTFKPAKTVTIDGATAHAGNEVIVKGTGEVGVIHTPYRGRAVIEFEDGRGEEFSSSDLEMAAQGDTPPVETPASGQTVNGAAPVEINEAALRDAARKVVQSKGSAETMRIIGETGGGALKVSEVQPQFAEAVYTALMEAAG